MSEDVDQKVWMLSDINRISQSWFYHIFGIVIISFRISVDETWLHYCVLESKQHSMQWQHLSYPQLKKFNPQTLAEKVMVIIFFVDKKSILMTIFFSTNTGHYSIAVLIKGGIEREKKWWECVERKEIFFFFSFFCRTVLLLNGSFEEFDV